jgi:hypothetical protein
MDTFAGINTGVKIPVVGRYGDILSVATNYYEFE